MQKKMMSLCLTVALLVFCLPARVWAAEDAVEVYQLHTIYGTADYSNENTQWTTVSGGNGNDMARSAPWLNHCSIGVTPLSTGLQVDFVTYCSQQAEEVGVRDIEIQKKVGIFWSTVATSVGGSQGDTDGYGGYLLYGNAEYGETYRVSCVHFAYCGGYDLQAENVTPGYKYEY